MCNKCYSEVEFVGILPTDSGIVINSGEYPGAWSVNELVDNNPQFYYAPGSSGVKTLHTQVQMTDIDLIITVTRGLDTVIIIAGFVKGRPDDRRIV